MAADANNLYFGTYSNGGGNTDGIFKAPWPATAEPTCPSNNLTPGIIQGQGFSYGVLLPDPANNFIYGAGFCGQVYALTIDSMQQSPTNSDWDNYSTSARQRHGAPAMPPASNSPHSFSSTTTTNLPQMDRPIAVIPLRPALLIPSSRAASGTPPMTK